MNKQDWALKLIGPHTLHDKKVGPVINFPRAVKLLKAEHARSVRIVKRFIKRYAAERDLLERQVAERILTALQRGRGTGNR